MFMVMFVLDDPHRLDALLEIWEATGVRGATIIESTGIHRRLKRRLPMRYLFQDSGTVEEGHFALFAIVESEDVAQACLHATERLVGRLDEPNTGVFAAWPLALVKGFPPAREPQE